MKRYVGLVVAGSFLMIGCVQAQGQAIDNFAVALQDVAKKQTIKPDLNDESSAVTKKSKGKASKEAESRQQLVPWQEKKADDRLIKALQKEQNENILEFIYAKGLTSYDKEHIDDYIKLINKHSDGFNEDLPNQDFIQAWNEITNKKQESVEKDEETEEDNGQFGEFGF